MNNLVNTGWFLVPASSQATTEKNYPVNGIGGVLFVMRYSELTILQIYYAYGGNTPKVDQYARHLFFNQNPHYISPWIKYQIS